MVVCIAARMAPVVVRRVGAPLLGLCGWAAAPGCVPAGVGARSGAARSLCRRSCAAGRSSGCRGPAARRGGPRLPARGASAARRLGRSAGRLRCRRGFLSCRAPRCLRARRCCLVPGRLSLPGRLRVLARRAGGGSSRPSPSPPRARVSGARRAPLAGLAGCLPVWRARRPAVGLPRAVSAPGGAGRRPLAPLAARSRLAASAVRSAARARGRSRALRVPLLSVLGGVRAVPSSPGRRPLVPRVPSSPATVAPAPRARHLAGVTRSRARAAWLCAGVRSPRLSPLRALVAAVVVPSPSCRGAPVSALPGCARSLARPPGRRVAARAPAPPRRRARARAPVAPRSPRASPGRPPAAARRRRLAVAARRRRRRPAPAAPGAPGAPGSPRGPRGGRVARGRRARRTRFARPRSPHAPRTARARRDSARGPLTGARRRARSPGLTAHARGCTRRPRQQRRYDVPRSGRRAVLRFAALVRWPRTFTGC